MTGRRGHLLSASEGESGNGSVIGPQSPSGQERTAVHLPYALEDVWVETTNGNMVVVDVVEHTDRAHVSPVGSGKTALLLALCRALRDDYNIGASALMLC